jgi:hypothetical protein
MDLHRVNDFLASSICYTRLQKQIIFKNKIMKRLDEYKYQEKADTLQELKSEKDKLKMLYQWVKQGVINFGDFEALIFYCS